MDICLVLMFEPGAPGGMVEFRQALPASFFFKFYLMVCDAMGQTIPAREASAIQRKEVSRSCSCRLIPS